MHFRALTSHKFDLPHKAIFKRNHTILCYHGLLKMLASLKSSEKLIFFSKNDFPFSFVHFAPKGPKRWLNLSSHISPTMVRLLPSRPVKIAQNLKITPENTESKGDKVGLIWSVRLGPRYGAARMKYIKLNGKSISKKKMKFSLNLREANPFEDSGSEKSLI